MKKILDDKFEFHTFYRRNLFSLCSTPSREAASASAAATAAQIVFIDGYLDLISCREEDESLASQVLSVLSKN